MYVRNRPSCDEWVTIATFFIEVCPWRFYTYVTVGFSSRCVPDIFFTYVPADSGQSLLSASNDDDILKPKDNV